MSTKCQIKFLLKKDDGDGDGDDDDGGDGDCDGDTPATNMSNILTFIMCV